MATKAQLANYFLGTGDSIAGAGRPIKELPKSSEHLAALAHSPGQREALTKFDDRLKEWVTNLQNTVKT